MPACWRTEKCRSFSRFTGFRYSILPWFEPVMETFFHAGDFQIWFRALLVTAVLTLFDASLLLTLWHSYWKIVFKTGLLWPLDFRVDSERKWRSFILIFIKDKMLVSVADFAFLHVFAEWHQNIPKWAGKLWSLIVKTLNFDWPMEHVFVMCVDR